MDLLPISDKCRNSGRKSWVAGGGMNVSEMICLPVQLQKPRPREGRDLPKVTQQNQDLCLWIKEPHSVRPLSQPWKTSVAGQGSGQEAKQAGRYDSGMCWGNKTPSLPGPTSQQAYVWPERALVICCPSLFRLVCQLQQQSAPNV